MRLIFALRWDFAEHCVFAWVRVLVRVCMCVWALAGVGPYWQSVEVKQLVWTVESELGFWAWPPKNPPISSVKCPFWIQIQLLCRVCVLLPAPSCIQYDNPEFSHPLLAALSPFFPPSHCHPHQTSLSVEENSFRSSLFQPQRVQQYKWGQVWVIN